MRDFQERVSRWIVKCFPDNICTSKKERAQRFLEEALELAQAEGISRDNATEMVAYVYGRRAGQTSQEVGGVMNTIAALCWNAGIDLEDAAMAEMERVERPEIIEKIRAKHKAKTALGGITGV